MELDKLYGLGESELEEKFIEVFSQPSMRKNKNC